MAEKGNAAEPWGGSLGLTSDYFVRGVSRSDDSAALQLDIHYLNPSGFIAGAFASDSRLDRSAPHDLELSGFLGFAWSAADLWRGRILAAHYSYPKSQYGDQYAYDEASLDISYEDWAEISIAYSPNSPHYLQSGQLRSVSAESAEINVQHPIFDKLSATAGVGYYYLCGPDAKGYAYASAGLIYDWAPMSFAVTYVNTSGTAKSLFYNSAASNRWSGTIIWRF